VGKIIKGKYFLWGTLLKANLGSRPSFAWISILAAKDLFKEGIMWRIDDVKSVSIWKDRYSVQTPYQILSVDATVNELFDPNTRGWNRDLHR
jgi:hypothetical protein